LIYHGHALILLDGLDEIIEIGQRQKIVDLVREFIDEHVRAPDFISAFDDTSFNKTMFSYNRNVIETQSPNMSGGNQIVVTSRIIGYQLYPLNGSFINHYSLGSMYHQEAKKFMKMWILTVEERILDILSNEGIKLGKEIVETISLRRNNSVESMFETDSK
jgi:predicted NACHT family NTPase